MTRHHDEWRASGGYFRNGYNSGDVMFAMGLSWPETVGPMLDGALLPVERARELISMIEQRPLTRERVGAHIFENMTDGVDVNPFQRMMDQVAAEAAGLEPQKKPPPNVDELFGFLNKRRDELLSILRKSVELGEPLVCSL